MASKPSPQGQNFESFMKSRGIDVSAEQREVLFREFLAWQGDRQRASRRVTRQD
jgi:osmotically-inducible protein OsmY